MGIALGVPVSYFYEGLYADDPLEKALEKAARIPVALFQDNIFVRRESYELLINYYQIGDDAIKADIQNLIRNISDSI